MDQEERQLEKKSTAKAGATAAHVAADYYTGGSYEKVRNAPIVGNVAKKAEQEVGEKIANMPGSKNLGKVAKRLDDAGALDAIDSASGMLAGSHDQKDVDALKNRGTNQAEHSASFSRRRKEDDEPDELRQQRTNAPLEGENEGLDSQDKNNKRHKTKDGKTKEHQGLHLGKTLKDSVMEAGIFGDIKAKLRNLKIAGIAVGICAGLFALLFVVAIFAAMGELMMNSLSSYFGIPEVDTEENMTVEEADGLLSNDEFFYDENGETYTLDELVATLKEDNACSPTFWTNIGDWWDGLDGRYNNMCSYLRYVESYITEIEEKYSKDNIHITLDRAIVLSTVFYGYGSQPGYGAYSDPNSAGDIIFASNHYDTLLDLLKDGKITKKDLEKIIDNTVADTSYTYYLWEVEDKENSKGEVIESIGKCNAKKVFDVRYSLKKWQIFMRFGEEAAKIWETDTAISKAIAGSDEECTGEVSDEELKARILAAGSSDKATIDSSVRTAHSKLKNKRVSNLALFEQKATINGHTKDIFDTYSSATGTVVFDYRKGFAYIDFPGYKEAFENPQIKYEYDDAITPKEIESTIQMIADKKTDINEILNFSDQDNPNKYLGSYDGYSSVILGAYCGDFLTAPIDQIDVYITDCDGKYLETVSMKQYIMGVAYREVSDSEDDYVKSEMLAAMSYALHRRSNYNKGTTIKMKSGNCDQAYCPMDRGCHSQTSSLDCGGFKCTSYIPGSGSGTNTGASNQERISRYEAYFEEVKDFLIIDKATNQIAAISYRSGTQNRWYEKAKQGMNFTQIVIETYKEDGKDYELVRCSSYDESPNSNNNDDDDTTTEQYGNGPTNDYPNISPSLGKFYGFSYSDIKGGRNINVNPLWKENNITTISSNCEEANWNQSYSVNVQAVDNYKKAFNNVCNILKNGVQLSNGKTCKYTINDLQGGETYIPRKTLSGGVSDVSYGITQDWNYNKKYTINGVTYQPYGYNRDITEYQRFIKALGNEESCENVNYILYKYAYEKAGFSWGGNWGRKGNTGTFNGMHFYVNY